MTRSRRPPERDAFFAHSGDERYQIRVDSSSSTDDTYFLAPNRRVRLVRLTAPPFDGPVADGASVRGPGHARDTQTASVLVASAFIVRVVPRIRPSQEFHAVEGIVVDVARPLFREMTFPLLVVARVWVDTM